ncbi:MAG TPA: hypothetical protein DCL43_13575 [Chitinophagaceae bacterium]|nr:hypothetical protein [Chitinophagaceae bacterium]HAN37506.1 hypothetical protein [Chitinophagaceae bacterium]
MRQILTVIITSAFFLSSFTTRTNDSETAKIQALYKAYETAVDKKDTKAILSMLSTSSKQYFDKVLLLAKKAKKTEVMQLPLSDKVAVLTLRHTTTDQELLAMNAQSFMMQSMDKGLKKNINTQNTLGPIIIKGNTATAPLVVNGKPSPVAMTFVKEGTAWKYDYTALLNNMNQMMQMFAAQANNEAFLMQMLQGINGKKPDASIWNTVMN